MEMLLITEEMKVMTIQSVLVIHHCAHVNNPLTKDLTFPACTGTTCPFVPELKCDSSVSAFVRTVLISTAGMDLHALC